MPKAIEIEEADILRLQLAGSRLESASLALQVARQAIAAKYGAHDGDIYTVKKPAAAVAAVPEEAKG